MYWGGKKKSLQSSSLNTLSCDYFDQCTTGYVLQKGSSMRLGSQNCELILGSKLAESYGSTLISERHRHRYEFNNKYLKDFENAGMVTTSIHPESKSTSLNPNMLFVSFVKAAKRLVR
jgi:CTP synthase